MIIIKNDINYYNSLHQYKFPFVDELKISQSWSFEDEYLKVNLSLILKQSMTANKPIIRLSFLNITDLYIKTGISILSLTLLEIFDIHDNQWEGLNYKVKETEDEKLSFFCKEFWVSVEN